jgi:hypothetical protein
MESEKRQRAYDSFYQGSRSQCSHTFWAAVLARLLTTFSMLLAPNGAYVAQLRAA